MTNPANYTNAEREIANALLLDPEFFNDLGSMDSIYDLAEQYDLEYRDVVDMVTRLTTVHQSIPTKLRSFLIRWCLVISAFINGMCEFKVSVTTHYWNERQTNAYDQGRELAHKLTLRQYEPD